MMLGSCYSQTSLAVMVSYIFHLIRIIVRCAGEFHVAQSHSLDTRVETHFADEPVGLSCFLVLGVLSDHDTEDVGEMFVECSRLELVF